jgi:hypothetical protein
MLVTVALLVLMMTIIVQVFQAATSAVSAAKTNQELDDKLRQLDTTLRQDLNPDFLTANLIPPLDPKLNLGYFEYGENSFADIQGEDTDDYIRFTTQAPPGQLFTGRMWVPIAGTNNNLITQPITITSRYAEIIYFLRNGNLYRRVLLVAPDRQSSILQIQNSPVPVQSLPVTNRPTLFNGANVSWQGMNDLSARPAAAIASTLAYNIILNTLGDLTNRENRPFTPRWSNDFANTAGMATPDGIADDLNQDTGSGLFIGDGVQDYLPGLYPQLFQAPSQVFNNPTQGALIFESSPYVRPGAASLDTMAFPYIYPLAYSVPDAYSLANNLGWIHSPDPGNSQTTVALLNALNHAPLDLGDNLPPPGTNQTWWGFPTWRETLSPSWLDPTIVINGTSTGGPASQPFGLHLLASNVTPTQANTTYALAAGNFSQMLPPMTDSPPTFYRPTSQLYNDGAGVNSAFALTPALPTSLWNLAWEDDLIMTGVRSFDVKAYDDAYAGYVDLGWGDDLRLYEPYRNTPGVTIPTSSQGGNLPPYLYGLPVTAAGAGSTPLFTITWPPNNVGLLSGLTFSTYNQTMAHEGRIPPLSADFRVDYQYPNLTFVAGYPNYVNNLGDNRAGIIRLRRVWDTWSTDYALPTVTGFDPTTKQKIGPPFTPPVYPSYPPPYPAPLKGLQIQIRVVDPQNQRVKVLTIRQDFGKKQVSPTNQY